jgi:hypothetical protein
MIGKETVQRLLDKIGKIIESPSNQEKVKLWRKIPMTARDRGEAIPNPIDLHGMKEDVGQIKAWVQVAPGLQPRAVPV